MFQLATHVDTLHRQTLHDQDTFHPSRYHNGSTAQD
jgi:hypothetical protein